MTTSLELFAARHKAERGAFVRVLKAVPAGRGEYRPEPRSRSALEIAWLLASEERGLVSLFAKGEVEWTETPPPASVDEIAALFESSGAEVDRLVATIDPKRWEATRARFLMGGQAVWEDTLEQMAWGFLFDGIHHRGQLSTYLRPMGGKVPAIYGPSADANE
ncbi:MAG TPA: DinB family protein [Vicinamibacteria bacterium]|nr:DinB family protein [Vicinamibacteria bacterium]